MGIVPLRSQACRKLVGVGLALFLPLALSWMILAITKAHGQGTDKGQHLVVEITSQKQLDALQKALKGVDKDSYRFTVKTKDGRTSTLGSLPLEHVLLGKKEIKSIHGDQAALTTLTSVNKITVALQANKIEQILKNADKNAAFQVKEIKFKPTNLVVEITSQKQLAALQQALKGMADNSSYRFTINTKDGKTSTLGSLSLDQVRLGKKQIKSIHGDEAALITLTSVNKITVALQANKIEQILRSADKNAAFQVKEVTLIK